MLSRRSDSLYWLSRYVERAENLARVLDVAYRMASMPLPYNGVDSNEWEFALVTAGAMEEFREVYDEVTPETCHRDFWRSPRPTRRASSAASTRRGIMRDQCEER